MVQYRLVWSRMVPFGAVWSSTVIYSHVRRDAKWHHKIWHHDIQGVSKNWDWGLAWYLGNQVLAIQMVLFSWTLRSICIFWIPNHFCAISKTYQFIIILCHSGLKTAKFAQSSTNWAKTSPDSSQVAPSGHSNPNWLNRCQNCFYLECFLFFWSTKLNNLSFDHNYLIMKAILFHK